MKLAALFLLATVPMCAAVLACPLASSSGFNDNYSSCNVPADCDESFQHPQVMCYHSDWVFPNVGSGRRLFGDLNGHAADCSGHCQLDEDFAPCVVACPTFEKFMGSATWHQVLYNKDETNPNYESRCMAFLMIADDCKAGCEGDSAGIDLLQAFADACI